MAVFPIICGEPQVHGSHQNFLGWATRTGGWMSFHVEHAPGVFKREHHSSLSTLEACSISPLITFKDKICTQNGNCVDGY